MNNPNKENEEIIKEIVEKVRYVEFLHGVPVELPSETKELLRSGIRAALLYKDQKIQEAVKKAEHNIYAELGKLWADNHETSDKFEAAFNRWLNNK